MNKKKLITIIAIAAVVVIAAVVTIVAVSCNKECEHSYSEWKVTTEAGCTTKGEKTHTCTKCGEVEKQSIEPTGHSGKDDGNCLTEVKCSSCGETIRAAQESHTDTDGDYLCDHEGCQQTVDGAPKDQTPGLDLPMDENK